MAIVPRKSSIEAPQFWNPVPGLPDNVQCVASPAIASVSSTLQTTTDQEHQATSPSPVVTTLATRHDESSSEKPAAQPRSISQGLKHFYWSMNSQIEKILQQQDLSSRNGYIECLRTTTTLAETSLMISLDQLTEEAFVACYTSNPRDPQTKELTRRYINCLAQGIHPSSRFSIVMDIPTSSFESRVFSKHLEEFGKWTKLEGWEKLENWILGHLNDKLREAKNLRTFNNLCLQLDPDIQDLYFNAKRAVVDLRVHLKETSPQPIYQHVKSLGNFLKILLTSPGPMENTAIEQMILHNQKQQMQAAGSISQSDASALDALHALIFRPLKKIDRREKVLLKNLHLFIIKNLNSKVCECPEDLLDQVVSVSQLRDQCVSEQFLNELREAPIPSIGT
jgi:hypothetical protein